jgi:two-component system, sensor histidine kinase
MYLPDDSEKIVVSVQDTGIGILRKDQKKLFQTFSCIKSAFSMNQQGVGLGLCITKEIIEQFGGFIMLKSKFGKGSRFTFCFKTESHAKVSSNNQVSLLNSCSHDLIS